MGMFVVLVFIHRQYGILMGDCRDQL